MSCSAWPYVLSCLLCVFMPVLLSCCARLCVLLVLSMCALVPVLASYVKCLCVLLCLSLSPVVPVFMCPLVPALVTSWTCPCALRCQFVYPAMPVFVLWRLSLSLLCFARSSISACRGSCQRAEKDEHSLFLPPQKWQV